MPESHDDIIYPDAIPFVLVHLACLAVFWTGITTTAVVLGITLYLVRMFAVTAGYHRYFSHRSYKTSRAGQFLLAFVAQSTAQKGALWWAAKHRHHHKHSDTPEDVHSPKHDGFFVAHVGWIFRKRFQDTDLSLVEDLARYPELRWLNKHQNVPTVLLAIACFLIGGWPGLVIGYFWSTVAVYHGTFAINSLAHVVGKRRFVTGDDSRNNWWLAVITLGEGWHNNHHAYMTSTRQGFRWYEFDPTYYVLKALSWVGIVWDLREPPASLVRGERRLNRVVVDKVARQLAESFPADRIAAQLREQWAQATAQSQTAAHDSAVAYAQIVERLRTARADAEHLLAELQMPHLPSMDDLRARATEMYAQTPSMDEIVERARVYLVSAVADRLLDEPVASPA